MSESNNELLINFDESGYKYQVQTLETFKTFFERCISQYNQLGLENFEEEDFTKLFLIPKTFLFNALMKGKPLSVGGLAVSKTKLYDLMEKPPGFESLITKIGGFGEMVRAVPGYYKYKFTQDPQSFLDYFIFSKGKIQLTKDILEQIRYAYGVYITKGTTKKVFEFVSKLEEVFNNSGMFGHGFLPPAIRSGGDIHRFLPYDDVTKTFHVDIERVKSFDINIDNR